MPRRLSWGFAKLPTALVLAETVVSGLVAQLALPQDLDGLTLSYFHENGAGQ